MKETINVIPLTCYLPVPDRIETPFSSVVLLGGLESAKEESYKFGNLVLECGMAVLIFDGPGHCEMPHFEALFDDSPRYTSAAADLSIEREVMDFFQIGRLGPNPGGLSAPRSAAFDSRFRACVSWVGFVTVDWDVERTGGRASWKHVTKGQSKNETRDKIVRASNPRQFLARLICSPISLMVFAMMFQ